VNHYAAALFLSLGILSVMPAEASDIIPIQGGLSVPAAEGLQIWNADRSYLGLKLRALLDSPDAAGFAARRVISNGWVREENRGELTRIIRRVLGNSRFSQIRLTDKGTVYQAEAVRFFISYEDVKYLQGMIVEPVPFQNICLEDAEKNGYCGNGNRGFYVQQRRPWAAGKSRTGVSYKKAFVKGQIFCEGLVFPVQMLIYSFPESGGVSFLAVVSDETAGEHMIKLLNQSVSNAERSAL
jgi:hypothetical protein